MKNFFKGNTILFLAITIFIFLPSLVTATSHLPGNNPSSSGFNPSVPPTTSGTGQTRTVQIVNPLGANNFCDLLKDILSAALQIGIPIAVLFLVYAGFLFVYARGNPEGLKKARTNLLYVVIGIMVFLGAWTIGQILSATIKSIQPQGGPEIHAC